MGASEYCKILCSPCECQWPGACEAQQNPRGLHSGQAHVNHSLPSLIPFNALFSGKMWILEPIILKKPHPNQIIYLMWIDERIWSCWVSNIRGEEEQEQDVIRCSSRWNWLRQGGQGRMNSLSKGVGGDKEARKLTCKPAAFPKSF